MLGLIPHLLVKMIETESDNETVATIFRRAGIPLDRKYFFSEPCPDDEWQRLFSSACEVMGLSDEQAEQAFAEFFGNDALRRWPKWFEMSPTARDLLQRQPVIHNTFAVSMHESYAKDEINDKFQIKVSDNEMITHYCSPNRLCGFYIHMARWLISHYGDAASIDEPRCMKRGDGECEIHIRWSTKGAEA